MCLISIILQIVQENNALFSDFIVRKQFIILTLFNLLISINFCA